MDNIDYNHVFITDISKLSIIPYYQPFYYFDPYINQGETFLVLTRREWDISYENGMPFTLLTLDYEDDHFIVLRFPSVEYFHRNYLYTFD